MEQTLTLSLRARRGLTARAAAIPEAAIIGGGIASALLSLALLRRGWQVTLYCADDAPALGASGNRQGALYPLLSKHDAALNRFFPERLLSLVGCMTHCRLNSIMTGAASRS